MRGYRIYNNQGNGHFTPSERAHTISMVTPKNWTTKNVPTTTKSNSFQVNGSNFYKRYHISLIQMAR